MAEQNKKERPWLVAAWPGMGSVALIAAAHLIQELKMKEIAELSPEAFFDVIDVTVEHGLVVPPRFPRGAFFAWHNPSGGRDLLVFVAEAQPASQTFTYARHVLDAAARFRPDRVVAFASLASGLRPTENPKVSGVATDADTLDELARIEVAPIADGQIGGMNGVILGAAAARGLSGMCLMAEIPFFAMNVPNPKAARAALSVFSLMAGIDIRLEALDEQAAVVDRALAEALEKIESGDADEAEASGPTPEAAPPGHEPAADESPGLSDADKGRLEHLFAAARRDPKQAVTLKKELDRLGVFREYEGRFLDLFRKAG